MNRELKPGSIGAVCGHTHPQRKTTGPVACFLHQDQRRTGTKRGQKRHPWNNDAQPMSPASRVRHCIVLMGLLLAFPALLWSQTNGLQPGELTLSGALRADQVFPAVAFGPGGGFVVWHDNVTDPSGLGISARRLNSDLVPGGGVIPVNQTMGNDQSRPKVAMLNDGGAVIVFQSGKAGAQNVLARFLTSAGGFAGDEVLVNNAAFNTINRYTTNWTLVRNNRPRTQKYRIREKVTSRHEFNANPNVITLNDGSVVVAYSSSRVYMTNTFGLSETLRWDDRRSIFITNRVRVPMNIRVEAMQDVYVQRLSAAGQKLGDEFRANQFVEFNQRDAALAALDNGNFVMAWVSEQQRFDNTADIYARVFNGLGSAVGDEFIVNTANGLCGSPSVAGTGGGGFTVVWAQRAAERASGMNVQGRAFDASGSAASDAFVINTFTYGDQFMPSVANLGSQQLVVWSSMGQDGSWEGTYARAFNRAIALGDEFRVNILTPYSQKHPRVASDGTGKALIIWSGYTVNSAFDLFGRLYLAP